MDEQELENNPLIVLMDDYFNHPSGFCGPCSGEGCAPGMVSGYGQCPALLYAVLEYAQEVLWEK